MTSSIPLGSQVAVVGGGVAGIVSAHLAAQHHRVSLFEAAPYLGGHTNSILLTDGPDAGHAIDTGFIVLNDRTYPNFHKFLRCLDVPVRYADMSFSYYSEQDDLIYGSRTLAHLFCQYRNLARPLFYRLVEGIFRFWRAAERAHRLHELEGQTLGQFLERANIPSVTQEHYILPMAGAIWSAPAEEMANASAESTVHFFKNHGLLGYRDQPRWQTVVGASFSYVKAFQKVFRGELRLGSGVSKIIRHADRVELVLSGGERRSFDYVVVAVHANQVLPLLSPASDDERRLFGAWDYKTNLTVLHTDVSHLPPLKRAWASWNYRRERARKNQGGVPITYNMNLLQGLDLQETYCVSLNPERAIDPKRIVKEIQYRHPVFSTAAIESQKQLNRHAGENRTFFSGSYHGFGFHEDAVRSAVRVGAFFSGAL